MGREPLSDDDRMARASRRFRESLIFGVVYSLVMVVLFGLYARAELNGTFQRLGFNHAQTQSAFPWIFGILTGVFVVVVLIRYWPTKADRAPAYLRKDMDNIHRRWRWIMIILCFAAVVQSENLLYQLPRFDAFSIGISAFYPVFLATTVCFGPGWANRNYRETLNDEMIRTLRARAARLGYLFVMLALAGLVFVMFYRPAEAIPFAVAILCAGSVIPTLYFVLLEWRAERETS